MRRDCSRSAAISRPIACCSRTRTASSRGRSSSGRCSGSRPIRAWCCDRPNSWCRAACARRCVAAASRCGSTPPSTASCTAAPKCRAAAKRAPGSPRDMADAYAALHELGFAHSAEAWQDGELVGGLYGVSLGHSLLRRVDVRRSPRRFEDRVRRCWCDSSRAWGFDLIDCQVHTEHLARFGAREWTRRRFLTALQRSLAAPTRRGALEARSARAGRPAMGRALNPARSARRSPIALVRALSKLRFAAPVTHVYQPLATPALRSASTSLRYGRGAEGGGAVRHESRAPSEWRRPACRSAKSGWCATGSDRSAGRQAGARAPEAAGRGLRVHAPRGLRPAPLGLRARSLRETRALLRALLRRQLLPAALPRGERPQPHARQAARRRARAARARLRSRAAPDHPAVATAHRRGRRPLCRSARARTRWRVSISRSAASRTRAQRARRRTAAGRSRPRAPSRS